MIRQDFQGRENVGKKRVRSQELEERITVTGDELAILSKGTKACGRT